MGKRGIVGTHCLYTYPFLTFLASLRFICSSNNHIARITKMVQSLCTEFSPPLVTCPPPSASDNKSPEVTYHAFPPPHKLADLDVAPRLRELGFGYRAEYIQRTAQLLCDEHQDPLAFLIGLRKVDIEEARIKLLKLHGVGPKVADCVLLMSLDRVCDFDSPLLGFY
jgi:N-glycosylase/DNA lyase